MRRPVAFPAVLAIAFLGMTSLAARAEADPFDRLEPDRMLGRVFSDDTLSLLFGLVRRSLAAAAVGGEAAGATAEEQRRLDQAATALRGEMLQAMGAWLGAVEAEARNSLREEFGNR